MSRKNLTRSNLFKLAEILAILSGTWMVAAAMFSAQAASGLAIELSNINHNVDIDVIRSAGWQLFLFILGLIFAFGSILSFIIGLFKE